MDASNKFTKQEKSHGKNLLRSNFKNSDHRLGRVYWPIKINISVTSLPYMEQ